MVTFFEDILLSSLNSKSKNEWVDVFEILWMNNKNERKTKKKIINELNRNAVFKTSTRHSLAQYLINN